MGVAEQHSGSTPAGGPGTAWREAPDHRRYVRADLHCHSKASDGPVAAALGYLGCPECYSEPERVFDQARARGMHLVTLTDHDTIAGGLELLGRGFPGVILGEEVTVHFPEDRCKLHVLVWGLTERHHEDFATLKLRDDVYAFAHYLREHNLAHALAHPLYIQNGRFTRRHLDRCALLFKAFETLNGAHSGAHRSALDLYLKWLTPSAAHRIIDEQRLEPLWPRVWEKPRTGGSDDHALLNVGRTWTEVPLDFEERAYEPAEFLRRVMAGRCAPEGTAGHPALLAHQLTTVAAHYAARTRFGSLRPTRRVLASRMLRFAGVPLAAPGRAALALDALRRRIFEPRKRTLPITRALREVIGPVLEKHPNLRGRLDPSRWGAGSALSEHESMSAFADELYGALHEALGSSALASLRRRDRGGIIDHLVSYAVLELSQAPYLFSLFHQNKERHLTERIEHECSPPGSGVGPLERPMRVSLFTDTLGDVNGVCRFIQNAADTANRTGRDLQVITCTKFKTPAWPNIFNFEPVFAAKIPKYENLDMVLPPLTKILRHVDKHQPDVIHISTPGPMGMVGYLAARILKVPVLGVYHTDFPAYVDHLFDDRAFTWMTERFMHAFYAPFRRIFTRSEDYVRTLESMGVRRERILALTPGVDTAMFDPRFRDVSVWGGGAAQSVKVLYVGRVSVEKNLPLLTKIWKMVSERLGPNDPRAELVVVGDGPYRQTMEAELEGTRTRFMGFRHGAELSALYASSDLFVFPSVTDTLGQVVMESQASGLPVLVSDQGGPKEVVREGETGFVLPAIEPARWADRIVELVRDAGRRRAMGAAAHDAMQAMSIQRSFEHFWGAHVDAWREHLAEIGIAKKDPGARPEPIGVPNGEPAQDRLPQHAQGVGAAV